MEHEQLPADAELHLEQSEQDSRGASRRGDRDAVERLQEVFKTIFHTRRPSEVVSGCATGGCNLVIGVSIAVVAPLLSPVIGAQNEGAARAAKGMLLGLPVRLIYLGAGVWYCGRQVVWGIHETPGSVQSLTEQCAARVQECSERARQRQEEQRAVMVRLHTAVGTCLEEAAAVAEVPNLWSSHSVFV